MPNCDYCHKEVNNLPWTCKRCGKTFCDKHRLPEDHNCQQLNEEKSHNQERWKNVLKEELGLNPLKKEVKKEDLTFHPAKIIRNYPKKRISYKRKKHSYKNVLIWLGILKNK